MKLKHLAGSVALAVTASAGAVTLQGGSTGVIDNSSAFLGGVHGTNEALVGFMDIFEFSVTGPGQALATFTEADASSQGAVFHFNTLLLADAANNPLPGAIDVNGADGWSVSAALTGAGNYHVILGGGIDPAADPGISNAFYLGAVGTVVNAVPEPGSYALMLLGLLAISAKLRQRR
ncbi:FxDxF family PEP-CTERM protein [Paucibacter soli]|uniref:FxDxF family PEP-CTERM protein n=1 Tax=Paucibacter soli TaxID=3133433 RepID=UPI0030AAABA1